MESIIGIQFNVCWKVLTHTIKIDTSVIDIVNIELPKKAFTETLCDMAGFGHDDNLIRFNGDLIPACNADELMGFSIYEDERGCFIEVLEGTPEYAYEYVYPLPIDQYEYFASYLTRFINKHKGK